MARPTQPDPSTVPPPGAEPLGGGNHRIKRLRRLVTRRKARSSERAFVVEGPALVAEALALVDPERLIEIVEVFVEAGAAPEIEERAGRLGLAVHTVTPGVLATVLDPVNPRPVAAVVRRPPATIADLPAGGLLPVLVDPRDPGNVGTLIRSAEAAGAPGVVLAGTAVDPTNPKVVRAAAGAGLRLPVVVAPDVAGALDDLEASGRRLVAATLDAGATPYDEIGWDGVAVLLGTEAHGLPSPVVERAGAAATIPLAGPTESLNLAVAGSLLCFEALRQRRAAGRPPAGRGDPSPGK